MSTLNKTTNSTATNTHHFKTLFPGPLFSHFKLLCSCILSHPLCFLFLVLSSPYILRILGFLSGVFVSTLILLVGFLVISKFKVGALFPVSVGDESGWGLCLEKIETYRVLLFEERPEFSEEESAAMVKEGRLGDLMKEADECENEEIAFGDNNADEDGTEDDKVVLTKGRNGSNADIGNRKMENGELVRSDGSTRKKERDWRRTLACKLYEDRQQSSGEAMDLLWETYELETTTKNKEKLDSKKKKKKKKHRAKVFEDEEEMEGKLCCLQALRFSTRKRRPNLAKMTTKAIKGFGWMQSVSKHSKKVHSGDI